AGRLPFAGLTPSVIVVAATAGTSSDTVNTCEPPALTVAAGGSNAIVAGASPAASTRTCAVSICVPSIAVTGTSAPGEPGVTGPVPDVCMFGTVTFATVSAPEPDMRMTVVSPCAGPVSVTVSGCGYVGAFAVVPTFAKLGDGPNDASPGAPGTRSA